MSRQQHSYGKKIAIGLAMIVVLFAGGVAQGDATTSNLSGSTWYSCGIQSLCDVYGQGNYSGHTHAETYFTVRLQWSHDGTNWSFIPGTTKTRHDVPSPANFSKQTSTRCPNALFGTQDYFRVKVILDMYGPNGGYLGTVTVFRGQNRFPAEGNNCVT